MAKKILQNLIDEIIQFQKTLINISKDNVETIIPGYTHLQSAQPISFAFHFLAYVEMLERDKERLQFLLKVYLTPLLVQGLWLARHFHLIENSHADQIRV